MKTIRRAIVGAVVLLLLTSAVHSFAIEGIQVSVQSSNVVLSWPSATNETYIVQYLPALLSTNSWLTLTDGFPAALNTNLTVFVDSNAVSPPVWMTNTSGGSSTNIGGLPLPPGGTNSSGLYALPSTGFYRVVRDGVHIFGLTNGEVLSGTIQQPIEFAVGTTDEIIGVSFYDTNDDPIIGSYAAPGPGGGWILNWNTTLSANGNYAIEAQLDFQGTNDPVVSVPVTVTVSNLFSFPNYLTQLYGSQMWIYAQTIPNADVEIDMYDENTNYLFSFYPVSDANGVISGIWDLTDGQGNTYNDTNFFGVWTVVSSPGISQSLNTKTVNSASPNFPLPTAKLTPVKKIRPDGTSPSIGSPASGSTVWSNEPKWTPNKDWVVGVGDVDSQVPYQFVYGGTTSPQQYGGIIGALQMPSINAVIAPGSSYDSIFDPIQIVSDANTRSNLLAFLTSQNPRYENFFWFGYGAGGTSISAREQATAITGMQLAQALNNGVFIKWGANVYDYAQHPYRFAWVDSINPYGEGNIGAPPGNFCEAFAIPAQDLSTNNFIAGGILSRAYLGYKNQGGFDANPSDGNWQLRAQMYSIFLQYLLQKSGDSLAALVYYAQNYQPPFSTYLGGPFTMDPSAVSYGATDIQDADNASEPW